MKSKIGIAAIAGVLCIAAVVGISKGKLGAFVGYLSGTEAYLGSSIVRNTRVLSGDVTDAAETTSSAYADHRRPFPDFTRDIGAVLGDKAQPEEVAVYNAFIDTLDELRARLAAGARPTDIAKEVNQLIADAYRRNAGSPRKIDDGALGGTNHRPEGFLFYVLNAETACGQVSEATIAAMRYLGFKTRLVILSHQLSPLIASHIVNEYFDPDLQKWVVQEPMVQFIGTDVPGAVSTFEAMNDPDLASMLTERHSQPVGIEFYSKQSAAWFERRGPVRTKVLYTPLAANSEAL